MNIKKKVSVHNRFDIEIRDKESGKLKQKGVAENMILDRAYSRICNFATYFEYIHFGTGTGTPTPERTTLFTPLGYKAVTVDEKVKEYPISKVTKKITLAPEEYVGQTITEVGISEATNAINTHALIKDAEGNPLSITKTDLDVLIIYATVFIELQDANDVTFSKFIDNTLVNYFVSEVTINPNLRLGSIGESTPMGALGHYLGDFPLTRTPDIVNKKVKFSTRLGIENGNFDIREAELSDICRINLEDAVAWNPYNLKDISIGIGDGTTDTFDLKRYDISNAIIKVDGNIVSNYSLENLSGSNREHYPLWKMIRPGATNIDEALYKGCFIGMPQAIRPAWQRVIEIDSSTAVGRTLRLRVTGGYHTSYGNVNGYIYVDGSFDGENYTLIHTASGHPTGGSTGLEYTLTDAYTHLRFRVDSMATGARAESIGFMNPLFNQPQIIFDTPPAANSLITADYTVPYIPKTSNYILDVNFELQFGEGV